MRMDPSIFNIIPFSKNHGALRNFVEARCNVPYTHQVKEHIRDFQCEMTFPKSRRDEIFIETAIKKTQNSEGVTYL
jgi:hypothetical protein